jgi:hypothetical protein
MTKLSQILANSSLTKQWQATKAAPDFAPLPPGEYVALLVAGELTTSRTNNTPGYKFTFEVNEGIYKGRHCWLDLWLTEAALPMTKRDLGKIGVTELEQLEKPLPGPIRCNVTLVLRRDDHGSEYNAVRRFEVTGIDVPEVDAFAPVTAETNHGGGNGGA